MKQKIKSVNCFVLFFKFFVRQVNYRRIYNDFGLESLTMCDTAC